MQTYSEFCKRLANDFNTLFNGKKHFSALDFKKNLVGTLHDSLTELGVSDLEFEKFLKDHAVVLSTLPENFDNGAIHQEDLESLYISIKNIDMWKNQLD